VTLPNLLSLFGRLASPFLVPAKTASAVARRRGQGRPDGRRALRASLDGDEHGRRLVVTETVGRTPRAARAPVWICSALAALMVGFAATPASPAPAVSRGEIVAAAVEPIPENHTRFVGDLSSFAPIPGE